MFIFVLLFCVSGVKVVVLNDSDRISVFGVFVSMILTVLSDF